MKIFQFNSAKSLSQNEFSISFTSQRYNQLLLVILGLLFFFPFLGSAHLFDWDENIYAEGAREMILSGDYTRVMIDFQPFWEKPPLFIWLQALSMHIWGINEFAARFPNAVFGIFTLLTVYHIGKKLYSAKFGMLWALFYFGSFLPHFYFKSGIIDPVFNFFIFTSIFFLANAIRYKGEKSSTKYAAISGILIGFAILAKGPVGFLILALTFISYWAITGFKSVGPLKNILVFAVGAVIVSSAWYAFEIIKNGPWFITEFINYQIRVFSTPDAGHKQPFFYHFVVALIGCFPASIFAIPSLRKKFIDDNLNFRMWIVCMFWVVMILFTIVTTKLLHYTSLTYYALSFLAAYYIYHLSQEKKVLNKFVAVGFLIVGSLFSFLLTVLPIVGYNIEKITPYIRDQAAVDAMLTPVPWNGFEFLIGAIYFILILIGYKLIKKEKIEKGISIICYSTAICLFIFTATVVPKIEKYAQGTAIEFYKSLAGEDVYVTTVGFRSFAHYFYTRKSQPTNENYYQSQWLLDGNIDKVAYFISKSNKAHLLEPYKDIILIKKEGGFAFFKRTPSDANVSINN
jgi:4-amino-4-deoxy-L-arabinose transferase-like glycosyltransferase